MEKWHGNREWSRSLWCFCYVSYLILFYFKIFARITQLRFDFCRLIFPALLVFDDTYSPARVCVCRISQGVDIYRVRSISISHASIILYLTLPSCNGVSCLSVSALLSHFASQISLFIYFLPSFGVVCYLSI